MQQAVSSKKLLSIYKDLQNVGVEIILDGGWGIDALLGSETRDHKDLDFLIEKKDVEKVMNYFTSQDYAPSTEEPSTWWHFMLESKDTVVDIHVIVVDETGKGIYGPPENGMFFPAESLTGKGSIEGTPVRCLSADYRIHCLMKDFGIITKTGYTPTKKDVADIAKLCKKFTIEMPEEFKALQ